MDPSSSITDIVVQHGFRMPRRFAEEAHALEDLFQQAGAHPVGGHHARIDVDLRSSYLAVQRGGEGYAGEGLVLHPIGGFDEERPVRGPVRHVNIHVARPERVVVNGDRPAGQVGQVVRDLLHARQPGSVLRRRARRYRWSPTTSSPVSPPSSHSPGRPDRTGRRRGSTIAEDRRRDREGRAGRSPEHRGRWQRPAPERATGPEPAE